MTFDKIIYREPEHSGQGIRLTVDFAIGEIAVCSSRGEVMWRRLAGPCLAVLSMKTAACGFEAWCGEDSPPDGDSPEWSLELCLGGRPVKRMNGCGTLPEHRPAFASLLELCLSLAEDRSIGRRAMGSGDERIAACF